MNFARHQRALHTHAATGAVLLYIAMCMQPAQAQDAPPAAAKSASPSQVIDAPPTAKQAREADDAYIAGARSLEHNNADAAEQSFLRALKLDPGKPEYALALAIAREHRVTRLVQEANLARLQGRADRATVLLAEALQLDPQNQMVAQHMAGGTARAEALLHPADLQVANTQSTDSQSDSPPDDSLPGPQPGAARIHLAGPIELQANATRHSFHLRSDVQDLLRQVYAAYGVSTAFDSTVLPQSVRIDVDNVDWPQALAAAQLVTNTFIMPLDAKSVLILKDTTQNRENYQHLLLETVFLPALTPEQMSDMGNVVRTVFGVKQATVQPAGESMSIRAPEGTLHAVNLLLTDLLDGGSELLLDMHLYEIDRTRTRNTGLQLPQTATIFNVASEAQSIISANQTLLNQLIASGAIQAGNLGEEVAALIAAGACSTSILCQPFAKFGGGLTETGVSWGPTTLNLALNTSSVRSVDDVQLRLSDHQTGTFRSGTRYPIILSSYSNLTPLTNNSSLLASLGLSQQQLSALGLGGLANGSAVNQQPAYPAVQYEDLGLTLKATPVIQKSGNVSLHMDFKLEALAGSSLNGNPVLNNRSYTSDITVAEGTSAVLMSSMSKTESTALSGLPGLAELPGFQSTLSNQNAEYDTQELVMIVTPHIVRRRHENLVSPVILLPAHEEPAL